MGARLLLAILLLLAGALLLLFSPAAAALEPCTVELTVDQQEVEAFPNSTNPSTASTTATVTTSTPISAERAVVSVQGTVDKGWPISISPQTFQVSGNVGRNTTVYITVVVPPGEPVGSGLVTLTARMTAGGLQCAAPPVNAPTIWVRPYIEQVALTTSDPLVQMNPGSGRSVTLTFSCKSNANVVLSLSYNGSGGVDANGPMSVTAPWRTDGTANSTLTLRITSGGADPGIYEVTIRYSARVDPGARGDGQLQQGVEVRQPDTLPGPGLFDALAAVGVVLAAGLYRRSKRGM